MDGVRPSPLDAILIREIRLLNEYGDSRIYLKQGGGVGEGRNKDNEDVDQ